MQKTLDDYGAGIQVKQVQMQKVDPPAQVIDAFRDVQAARADLERAQNEAQTYANRVVPEARGRAAQILQARRSLSRADRRRGDGSDVALHQGLRANTRRRPRSRASACISRPWNACSAAPTRSSSIPASGRQRGGNVVPYPAAQRNAAAPAGRQAPRREARDEARYRRRRCSPFSPSSRRSSATRRCSPSIRRSRRWWSGSVSRSASSPSRA